MTNSWVPFFGGFHLFSLLALCWITASKVYLRPIPRVSASLLFFWSNLVIAGNSAALFDSLNQPIVYACLSWALACLLWLVSKKSCLLENTSFPAARESSGREKIVAWILTGLLAAAFGCGLAIALGILPANPDSLTYRFPRVYWYVDSGTLLHHGAVDFRTKVYPLNGVLLYAPIAIYRLSPAFFPLVSLASWSLIILVNYEIARHLGCRKITSLTAAFLIGMAPNVFAQATSTNDEILSAAALVCGLYFSILAWQQSRAVHYGLAGAAFGLSFGTKLHFYFHLWMLPLVALAVLWMAAKNYQAFLMEIRKRALPVMAMGLLALFLSTPFFFWNKASSNSWFMESNPSNLILKPLDASIGFQNFALHLGQMMLSPVPDLMPTSNEAARPVYKSFNKLVEPLFAWRNEGPSYWQSSDRFEGAASQAHSNSYSENSIWHGFLPHLMLVALAVLAVQWRKNIILLGLLLGLSFWFYYISLTFQTRYANSLGIYLTYAVASTGILFACFAEVPLKKWANRLRWTAIGFVILTHCIFAVNLLHKNAMRNLPMLLSAQSWPVEPSRPDPGLIGKLTHFSKIHAVYTHWGVPYFNLISWTPQAKHSTSPLPDPSPDTANIYVIQAAPSGGYLPVKLLPDASVGLAADGFLFSARGKKWVLSDPSPEQKKEPKYIILAWKPDPSTGDLLVIAKHPGRGTEGLKTSYALKKNGALVSQAEGAGNKWLKLGGFDRTKLNEYQLEASLSLENQLLSDREVFGFGDAESIKMDPEASP